LILDVKLGYDEEGYGVAKELPDQKILFVTGYDLDTSKIKHFNNVIGTLKKPIDNSQLLKIIRKKFRISQTKE
jgi:hypothetical protein